jgi:hypothetical protein
MKQSLENYEFSEGIASGAQAAGDHNGASVDHQKGPCAAFIVNCGVFGTTFSAKVQYSDDDSVWTDEPTPSDDDGYPGNDVTDSLGAEGQFVLHVPNPRARYSRVVVTTVGASTTLAVINCVGPLRRIGPAATV